MLPDLVVTAAIAIAVAGVRAGVAPLVSLAPWLDVDGGRRSIVVVRNLALLIGLIGVMIVWSEQLRVVGVSLVAVAVAVVIAGQDLIRSALGSVARTTSTAFSVGDQIVVGQIRGYVIDSSVMSTTLLEIGPGHLRTGRTVTIPNSSFLTEAVVNETGGHRFILHSFQLAVPLSQWCFAVDVLQAAAEETTASYVEPARRQMEARARRHSLTMPMVQPLVLSSPAGPDTVSLTVRVPVAAQDVWQVEHDIARAWLTASAGVLMGLGPAESGENEPIERRPSRRRDDLIEKVRR